MSAAVGANGVSAAVGARAGFVSAAVGEGFGFRVGDEAVFVLAAEGVLELDALAVWSLVVVLEEGGGGDEEAVGVDEGEVVLDRDLEGDAAAGGASGLRPLHQAGRRLRGGLGGRGGRCGRRRGLEVASGRWGRGRWELGAGAWVMLGRGGQGVREQGGAQVRVRAPWGGGELDAVVCQAGGQGLLAGAVTKAQGRDRLADGSRWCQAVAATPAQQAAEHELEAFVPQADAGQHPGHIGGDAWGEQPGGAALGLR